MNYHAPVMVAEVVRALGVEPDGTYLDATAGGGGHAEAIASRLGPEGRLLALDRDDEALGAAGERLRPYGDRVSTLRAAFSEIERAIGEAGMEMGSFDGALFDLGVSSRQIDEAQRGFSFQREGPLDMRMDRRQATTARDLVMELSEGELADLMRRLGDEPRAGRIARELVRRRASRGIETTTDLARVVEEAVGRRGARSHHPATRVFQALRMAVNREPEELEAGLAAAYRALAVSGRLVVLTYHSGEDRVVKRFIREGARGCVCPPELPVCACGRQPVLRDLSRGGVTPGEAEVGANPRARSARLRVAERLA